LSPRRRGRSTVQQSLPLLQDPHKISSFPFYRLATIGWANPLLRPTVQLLNEPPSELTVDLSAVTFLDSFGVTYLAACVHHCLQRSCTVTIRAPRNQIVSDYLQNVGFYESFGLADHFPARKPSTSRVDLVHISALEPQFIDYLLDFLEHLQPFDAGLRPSMRLTLLELVQNFAEHSGSPSGAWVAGQYHPFSKESRSPRTNICVLDLGRGIPNALRTVSQLRKLTDPVLVERATREGVSSSPGSRGRGLSTIREVARVNGGTMTIVAGNARVRFRSDRRPERFELDEPFPGSAVFLSLVPTARGLYVMGG